MTKEEKYLIGGIIEDGRVAREMTQEQLGNIVGVTRQSVSGWECGKTAPDKEIVPSICKALGIDVELFAYYGMPVNCPERIYELGDIKDTLLLDGHISKLLNQVSIDPIYSSSILSILEKTLRLAVGETIINDTIKRVKEIDHKTEWLSVRDCLMEMIGGYICDLPDGMTRFDYFIEKVKEKTAWLTVVVREMFLSFINKKSNEERKYTKNTHFGSFEVWTGEMAKTCGNNLMLILPSEENALVTSFMTALVDLTENLVCFGIDKEDAYHEV